MFFQVKKDAQEALHPVALIGVGIGIGIGIGIGFRKWAGPRTLDFNADSDTDGDQ